MNTKLPQLLYFNNSKSTRFTASHFLENKNRSSKKNDRNFSDSEKELIVIEGQSGLTDLDKLCLREGITHNTFKEWSADFLKDNKGSIKPPSRNERTLSEDEKYRIVLDGNSGDLSVAEICKKEGILKEEFLAWNKEFLKIRNKRLVRENEKDVHTRKVKATIEKISGPEVLEYFESFLDVTALNTKVFNGNDLNIENTVAFENVVCLTKINEFRFINKHFESVNAELPMNGFFIGCLETFTARRARKGINGVPFLNDIYFGLEFVVKRILPKLNLTKGLYFDFTKGKDRLLSKAEGLGRLVSCGFKIVDFKDINGLIYFVVKKVDKPSFDMTPSYGPVYRMSRIGKDGRIIKVFKFRTMHPYSEYLQDYILKVNGYAETGKPAEDFRIPKWGMFFRRYWLDEVPQIINVLKGEMKLVGIRPVSERYFKDIPKEMQKLRLSQKPGCIPPYVALNRNSNVMSVLQAEKDYLIEKIKHPYTTDLKYFFKAAYNIVIKSKRSA